MNSLSICVEDYRAEPSAGPAPVSSGYSAQELSAFARTVSEAGGVVAARRVAVQLAARLLDIPWAALTRPGTQRSVVFVATCGDAARQVARIAQRAGEGPCWQVHADGEPVVCPDLAHESRWTAYATAVLDQAPVRSAVGLPLCFAGELLGALLLYAERPGRFDASRLADALVVADQAALALAHVATRAKADNLEVALRTNREIAIAIGVVMDRMRITEQQAFDHLRQLSECGHVKLRDIATRIALTGEVPDAPAKS